MKKTLFIIFLLATSSIYSSLFATGLNLYGVFEQGGLVTGFVTPHSKVIHDGLRVRTSRYGIFLIGFNRDAKSKSKLCNFYSIIFRTTN